MLRTKITTVRKWQDEGGREHHKHQTKQANKTFIRITTSEVRTISTRRRPPDNAPTTHNYSTTTAPTPQRRTDRSVGTPAEICVDISKVISEMPEFSAVPRATPQPFPRCSS